MNSLRFRALKAVFKKEILDVIRDKRTLAIMILMPLILYPALMLGVSQAMTLLMESREEKVLSVAFDFPVDSRLAGLLENSSQEYKLDVIPAADPGKALAEKKIMSYVTRETVNGKDTYKIVYKSSESETQMASQRLEDLLKDYKLLLTQEAIEKAGLNAENVMNPIDFSYVDTAVDEEKTGTLLGIMLPYLLIVALVTGAMYPAIDVTAGEKERGTLETLLTLPVSNLELMGGKFLAVALVAVGSAILNCISLTIVGVMMMNSISSQAPTGGLALRLDPGSMIVPFLIILVCIIVFALFVSAIILCVTSLAKSFKEANNYLTPVMILFMLPAFANMIPEVTLTPVTSAIPVVNISLLIRDALMMKYNALNIAIVLISTMGYALIAVILLARIHNSENLMFGTGGDINFLGKRSHIIRGSKINPGDAVILYVVGLLLLFYLSSFFYLKLGAFHSLIPTQGIILLLPVLAAAYLKADLRETFKLRMPRGRDILGGIVLWMGAFILANIVGNLLLELFPQNNDVVSQLEAILKGDTLWKTLVVVALLPAICEELFFRGFIFSSLEGRMKPAVSIFLTGLMFAIYHLDLIRIAPTFILGVLFTLALYRTRSIVVTMLMHFLNNAVAVITLFYPQTAASADPLTGITSNLAVQSVIYILVAAVLIGIGSNILKPSRPNVPV
ncbi:ABC transporter permease subunit [Dehalobacter sp. DCM]|uniref:ABC transporter permease subunit/CPBP intramembrane protease n=1 Tax=Dehalobacter sp. DCM TaxID=2907827 RepID=UPI0030818F3E|nr:ABC transporter permease subunit [Dehalobacter sp. DCM]